VQIAPQAGGYQVTAPGYVALVGADGNLHSLRVNTIELLDDRAAGSAGVSYFVEKPIPLPTLTLDGLTLTATDGTYTTKYEFDEGFIQLTLKHANPKGAAFVAVCAGPTAFVENLAVAGVAAATPTDQDWGDVSAILPTGEFLMLHGGTRVWGRGLGRQVWERSNMPPNKECTVTLVPGHGQPRPPEISQLVTLTAASNAPNRLAAAGQTVELQGRFENNSAQDIATEVVIHVESTTGAALLDEKKPITCKAHEGVTLTWTVTPKAAEFYTVVCTVGIAGTVKRATTTFGYDVAHIAPAAQKPADFADYWQRVVTEAAASEVKLTRLEDRARSTGTVTVYRIGVDADGFTCFGWLAVPKFPGKYPGLLLLPGDRVRYITPNAALAEFGFVVMTIEPTGLSVDGVLKPLITRATTNLNDPAAFGLRTVMLRYLRAVTALAAVAEVDAHRLAVTGVGLGGGLAMILGALDDRIQAAAPDVPFYCHIEHGRASATWPYQDVAAYLRANPGDTEAVFTTLRYFDVANFTDDLTCPVLVSAGIHDLYARPANIYGVVNRLPGPHAITLYDAGHEGGGLAQWEDKMRWLNKLFGAATPPPAAEAAAP
jgi:cephalosporin-C deacetylase